MEPNKVYDSWYMLGENPSLKSDPDEGKHQVDREKHLGDLRLQLHYSEQKVFPAGFYTDLLTLLLDEKQEIVLLLSGITQERDVIARSLVNIFQAKNNAVLLLNSLTGHEIDVTPSPDVIFRGNSLATKSVDVYMKLIGLPYLHKTLGPHIKNIMEHHPPCEVDPTRITEGENVQTNLNNLIKISSEILSSIFSSIEFVPHELRKFFQHLQSTVIKKYGANHITRYTAVSGFLFLRFWGPAILGPKLFGLWRDHPNKVEGRTLTLIAKTVQALGNLAEFGNKEPYMKGMNKFLKDSENDMKKYLDLVSTIPIVAEDTTHNILIDLDLELSIIVGELCKCKDKILQLYNDPKPPSISKLIAVIQKFSSIK